MSALGTRRATPARRARPIRTRAGATRRPPAILRRTGVLALLATGLLPLGAPSFAQAAKASKPIVSGLEASPSTVASGGVVTVSANVTGATTCELAATKGKPVSGLPIAFACESGTVAREVTMPVDAAAKPAIYKLTLIALEGTSKAKASLRVTVNPGAAVSVSSGRLSAGGLHACGVKTNGGVECWGAGLYGELGNESEESSSSGVAVQQLEPAAAVGAGGLNTCALTIGERVKCWGNGIWGQLGDHGTGTSLIPVRAEGIEKAVGLATGPEHSCALLSTGRVMCWGRNELGALGRQQPEGTSDVPLEVTGLTGVTQLTAGDEDTCALLAGGTIDCWGLDTSGQLGHGAGTETSRTPVPVSGIGNAIQVSAGAATTCAVLTTHRIDCWGWNQYGQLGNESNGNRDEPVEVEGITEAVQVSVGWYQVCALMRTGSVDCWGGNAHGELGIGSLKQDYNFPQATSITNASELSAGYEDTCALLATNHAECWGANEYGQLGDGGTEASILPVPVSGLP